MFTSLLLICLHVFQNHKVPDDMTIIIPEVREFSRADLNLRKIAFGTFDILCTYLVTLAYQNLSDKGTMIEMKLITTWFLTIVFNL